MCSDEQHSENLAALGRIEKTLKLQQHREPKDQTVSISDTQGWILDYQGYKHLYIFSANALNISIGDIGLYAIQANTWTSLEFRAGFKIFTVGQATTVNALVRATDERMDNNGGSIAGKPVYNTATGTSAGAVSCTLPAPTSPNLLTYIQGFVLTSQTNASVIAAEAFVSLDGGTTQHLKFEFCVPVSVGGFLPITFPGNGLPATAPDTSIVVTIPSMATGTTKLAISAWGVQQV